MTGASLEGDFRAATEATSSLPMRVGCSHAGVGLGEASAPGCWVKTAGSFPFAPAAGRCLRERPGTPANEASATMTSAAAASTAATASATDITADALGRGGAGNGGLGDSQVIANPNEHGVGHVLQDPLEVHVLTLLLTAGREVERV